MNVIQNIFLKDVVHGEEPRRVATEIFETHDFGGADIAVVGIGGAESAVLTGKYPSVKIPFYAADSEGGDSIPMLFQVDFLDGGADVSVYTLV